jgi:hypothetical protein
MTPQERQMMAELFNRLASLENSPRDPDAEAMIREGFRRAPNAAYALVQTVLLQDEALKAANAHIQEYEQRHGAPPPQPEQPRGFLDNMRDSLLGRDEPRGSVPRVPPGGQPMGAPSPWGQGGQGGQSGYQQGGYQQGGYQQGAPMQAPPQQGGGGSFLGTAAAAAAGLIGGSLLMGGIRSAMGGHGGSSPASGAFDSLSGRSPGSGNAANSDLARDAGLGDVGNRSGSDAGDGRRAGLFDGADTSEGDSDESYEDDGDAGYDDGGDSQQ